MDIQSEWETYSGYRITFNKLSWQILEAKYIYYILNGEHDLRIDDFTYDS